MYYGEDLTNIWRTQLPRISIADCITKLRRIFKHSFRFLDTNDAQVFSHVIPVLLCTYKVSCYISVKWSGEFFALQLIRIAGGKIRLFAGISVVSIR